MVNHRRYGEYATEPLIQTLLRHFWCLLNTLPVDNGLRYRRAFGFTSLRPLRLGERA